MFPPYLILWPAQAFTTGGLHMQRILPSLAHPPVRGLPCHLSQCQTPGRSQHPVFHTGCPSIHFPQAFISSWRKQRIPLASLPSEVRGGAGSCLGLQVYTSVICFHLWHEALPSGTNLFPMVLTMLQADLSLCVLGERAGLPALLH